MERVFYMKEGVTTWQLLRKSTVSLDVTQPAQEVASVITLILGMYPGREIEILWQIEEGGGSALARLEHGERTIAAEEAID